MIRFKSSEYGGRYTNFGYFCVAAQFFYSIRGMKEYVVHNEDGLLFRPPSAMPGKLINEVLE